MYADPYVPNGTPLRLAVPTTTAIGAGARYWFAGAAFPRSYLKLTIGSAGGIVSGISLVKADIPVPFDDRLDSCPTRIPGVPVCDLSAWPSASDGSPVIELREPTPIGLAGKGSTIQVSLPEAGAPTIVYESGDVSIAIDASWNLCALQVRNLHEAHVQSVLSAILE